MGSARDQYQSSLRIERSISIEAPLHSVYESLIEQLGAAAEAPDGTSMPMKLEAWPGGRWFRDLGEGCGHFWGQVQVIKPPTLLEIYGPLFMSYPVSGHVAFRVEPAGDGSRLTLRHRALGLIDEGHRKGVTQGWKHYLSSVRSECE